MRRSRACLAEPPARVALDDENLRAFRGRARAVGELAGQAQLAHRGLARDVFFLAAAQPFVGALDDEIQELVGLQRVARQPVVERVLDRVLDDLLRRRGGQAILGLALEFRLADEHREHAAGAGHHVFAGHGRGAFFLAGAGGVILQAAQQSGAQTGLVGAAIGGRNRVAIGLQESVGIGGPGDRPFDRAVAAGFARAAGEDVGMHQRGAGKACGEVVLQPVGEMEGGLFRHVVEALEQRLVAMPADLDAAIEISLGARHLEHALGLERGLRPENLRIGPKSDLGAAPVGRATGLFQLALRLAALERHLVELLLARDLDLHALGQRVGDRDADAVQAARGLIDLGVEFAAGMQHAHDHFERGLVLEFRMRVDRNAAAVIGDADEAVRLHLDFDPVGVAGERLVHGIVDHLGEQVMQRLLVGAADIHAGAAAHRLEPLQHLDMFGGVAGLRAAPARRLGAARGLGRAACGGLAGGRFRRPRRRSRTSRAVSTVSSWSRIWPCGLQ